MKVMKHLLNLTALLLWVSALRGQDIEFDQGNWQSQDLRYQRRLVTVLVNEERVDSAYTENLSTGEMTLYVSRFPLARYEYFTGIEPFPPLRRRIVIRQHEIVDTSFVENIITGDMEMIIQKFIKDIPYGEYTEYHRNGNLRVQGQLAGYGSDGKLVRKGEWAEWDESGNLIWTLNYP